jgi:hypothetical protein
MSNFSGKLFIAFVLISINFIGQNLQNDLLVDDSHSSIELKFRPEINRTPLVLNQSYYIPELKDSITILKLKFYVSNISFYQSEEFIAQAEQRYFLFDLEDKKSMYRSIVLPNNAEFDNVKFNIGVDSTTQMKGAQGGDLDPMHGMYWSWQSGYVNFKLEGSAKSCPGRNHVFQFHIGGFQSPYNSLQNVHLSFDQKDELIIILSLDTLFTQANITQDYKVMSPSERAIGFADQLPQIFNVKP